MLSFDEAGQSGGKPLILVHGWCCNRRHMAGLFQHFSRSRHVFAVDLPGHGQTPIQDTPPLMDAFAASLSAFLIERQLFNAILVGHSMGGLLSVLAAGQQSERVAGVVSLDGPLPLTAQARAGYEGLFSRIRAEGYRAVAARFVREVFFLPLERGSLRRHRCGHAFAPRRSRRGSAEPVTHSGRGKSANRLPCPHAMHRRFLSALRPGGLGQAAATRVDCARSPLRPFCADLRSPSDHRHDREVSRVRSHGECGGF